MPEQNQQTGLSNAPAPLTAEDVAAETWRYCRRATLIDTASACIALTGLWAAKYPFVPAIIMTSSFLLSATLVKMNMQSLRHKFHDAINAPNLPSAEKARLKPLQQAVIDAAPTTMTQELNPLSNRFRSAVSFATGLLITPQALFTTYAVMTDINAISAYRDIRKEALNILQPPKNIP